MLIVTPQPAHSATLGIGAAGWYTWWDPKAYHADAEADPAPMYGPQLLLSFSPQVSLSSVFLYGAFTYRQPGYESTTKRYDSDTTLSYSLNQYVRVIGGVKFMGYSWESGRHLGAGPGLGVGFVAPLAQNIFCALNISGMYLWGNQDDDSENSEMTYGFNEWGTNSSISLVFMIPSSSVSLSLGGRYFYFKILPDKETEHVGEESHHFYGVTASAMYMISL
jgi:hypothetical protein